MRQRPIFFLVVLLLMFQGEIFGQVRANTISNKHSFLKFPIPVIWTQGCYSIDQLTVLKYNVGSGDPLKRSFSYEMLKRPGSEVVIGSDPFGQHESIDRVATFKYQLRLKSAFGINLPISAEIQSKDTTIKPARQAINYAVIGGSYYSDRFGIICKAELQLQKKTSIPIRLRLGSLEYVNWMEQKPNAVKPR